MNEPREILDIVCIPGEDPKMIWLGADPWGYQCSVPADWLKKWLELPEGGSDNREGKAWWYSLPKDQEMTLYQVENHQGVLYIEVEVGNQLFCKRHAVLPVEELRHWFATEPKMINLVRYNCFVPHTWFNEWLRLPEGGQDERVGKTWGYLPPDDDQDATYRAKRMGGYLIVEIKAESMPKRLAVVAIADFNLG